MPTPRWYEVDTAELRVRLQTLPDSDAVFMAQTEADAVGWVHVSIGHSLIVGPRVELSGLAVAAEAQGLGVGSVLLEAAEQWAEQRGIRTMYLRSGAEREKAHAFYFAHGYEAVKTQVALSKIVTPSAE